MNTRFKLDKFNSLQTFQFLRYGTFFVISILLAKIAMIYQYDYGLTMLSSYENLMLVSSSLTFFWVGGICNTLIPYYNNADEAKRRKVLFNTFILLLAFSMLASITIVILGIIDGHDQNLYNMFALVVLLNTPTYITDYIFYLREKYKALVIWGVITLAAQILMLCTPLFFRQSLGLAINMLLVLALFKFNYTLILLLRHSTISVNTRMSLDFLQKATPVIFSILIAGSMEYINSYIVRYNFSKEQFAIFRYGARELPIFLIFANSLSNIYSGEISRFNAQNRLDEALSNLKKAGAKLMRWMFPLSIVLLFASPYMFKYLYSDALVDGYKIFNIYLLLIVSRMLFPQTVIMGLMKNRVFYLISTNELIINGLLAFWFVSLFGITGIAYASAIAFMAEKIMLLIYCRMEGIVWRRFTPIVEYFIYSLILLTAFIISVKIEMPMP
ncbi:MAG: lipopolysaccharide biosynthesis protein [Bacteroidia bacterium]